MIALDITAIAGIQGLLVRRTPSKDQYPGRRRAGPALSRGDVTMPA
jgi:hypothetical protein